MIGPARGIIVATCRPISPLLMLRSHQGGKTVATLYTAAEAARQLNAAKDSVLRHAAALGLGARTLDGRLLGLTQADIERLRTSIRRRPGRPPVAKTRGVL